MAAGLADRIVHKAEIKPSFPWFRQFPIYRDHTVFRFIFCKPGPDRCHVHGSGGGGVSRFAAPDKKQFSPNNQLRGVAGSHKVGRSDLIVLTAGGKLEKTGRRNRQFVIFICLVYHKRRFVDCATTCLPIQAIMKYR